MVAGPRYARFHSQLEIGCFPLLRTRLYSKTRDSSALNSACVVRTTKSGDKPDVLPFTIARRCSQVAARLP